MSHPITPAKFVLHAVESFLGALVAFGVGLLFTLVSVIFAMTSVMTGPTIARIAAIVLLPVSVLGEWRFLGALRSMLGTHHHPLATALAMKQRLWPAPLRPLVAIWYLAHFVVASVLLLSLQHKITGASASIYARGAWCAAITFVGSFTSNLYLVLAARSASLGEGAIRAVWQKRIAIDATVALIACFLPMSRWFA